MGFDGVISYFNGELFDFDISYNDYAFSNIECNNASLINDCSYTAKSSSDDYDCMPLGVICKLF